MGETLKANKKKAVKTPAKLGRPTTYSDELASEICEQLAMGMSMRTVSKNEDMPAMSTMFKWLKEHPDFSEQYTRAKQESADAMAEDILDIADDGTNDWVEIERDDGSTYERVNNDVIQRSRLRVETRKWLMAKMKPKVYGDKLELDGKVDSNVTIQTVTYAELVDDNNRTPQISA